MKRSIIIYSLLTLLIFSLLIVIGCVDKKGTEVEIPDKDQVEVTLIDSWDLWEYQQISTTRVNKGNLVRKPSKTISRTFSDEFGYPFLVEEFYLSIEKHKVTLGGEVFSSEPDDIESLHFIDNQMWTVDTDDIATYHFDYYYNEVDGSLWLREETTADTLYAFDPTEMPDSLGYDPADFMLFFRQGGGPKLDLSEPDNNTLISDLTPLFAWEDYPNTTEYIFQVRQDTMFSEETGFVINEIVTTNEYQTQEDLENFSGFFWRVKSDNSDWSNIWTFGINYIVTLSSPPNNSYVHLKPTFNWEDYDGATEYTIEISEDIHFENDVISATTSNSQYVHSENLLADKEYFWKVKADNSEENWSNVRAINTTKGVNISHSSTSPADEETEVEIPVTFDWQALDNADNYTIWVSDDAALTNLIIDETVTDDEYTETGVLEINQEYFWAINSDVSAVWSDTISFKTNISPLLVSPANDSINVGVITQFTWDVYTDAQTYVIQVDENASFNDPIVDSYIYYDGDEITCDTASRIRENDDETIDFIPLLVEDFEGGTQYFWRVQRDSLEWSEVWNFTTISPTTPVILETPLNNETGVGQLPRLEWDSATGSTFYRAEVCHEETFTDTMWVNIITENRDYTLESNEMLLVGETYYWRIRSDVSQWSEVWEFTVRDGIPDIIELSISEEAPHKIDMTWECGSGEHTAFLIERSINQTDWEEISSVDVGSVNEFVDFDKEEITTYYYRMRTENPVGYSSYSDILETTTLSFDFDNPPDLVNVAAGSFEMGSEDGDDDEQPIHTVTLTHSFELGECEITNKEYCEVLNWALGKGKIKEVYNLNNVSGYAADAVDFSGIINEDNTEVSFDHIDKIFKVTTSMENHPMDGVKWFGGAVYANWLSQIDYLNTLYSWTNNRNWHWSCDVYGAEGYRLPTEAEWEFSARGGNNSGNYTYSGSNNVDDIAWHYGNANGESHEVKQKDPNELDTYDMSGNLWEWCNDEYDADYYSTNPVTDPTGPSDDIDDCTRVVLRGGSWEYEAYHLRNANRSKCKANLEYGRVNTSIGFRIVRINP